MAGESDVKEVVEQKNDDTPKKVKRSIFSRIWNGLIRLHGDDFEKRLQHISKEEATILARMKKRSKRWRRTARNITVFSVLLEVVAIGYAIMTTRSINLEWEMRALRVLPMFVLPCLSWALYSGIRSYTGFRDQRDQRALDNLRDERQAKINELKDKTNYYNTQQLIQRYDSDPAAKAAAASVLASKLGAESGLQVNLDDALLSQYGLGKSNDFEVLQSSGLRRRNTLEAKSPGSNSEREGFEYAGSEVSEICLPSELVVEHSPVALGPQDNGWIARLAALLVGEDPTQSYALICGNCHMHNGLARKEDFLVITYYCPHCQALNRPKNLDENSSCLNSPNMRSPMKHPNALNKPNLSDENSSDTNSHDMTSSKIKTSDEKSSDVKNPGVKSSTKAVANAKSSKKTGTMMGESVSAKKE
ncbi:hypothetical protein L2E82_02338 [Cichorium intybus]|uniref:Uncharacterized protein n=1 Tax=Cichorium intybus TaxID=13427 RepID=A0ACB9H1B7_CICIN|nr:hypothetical protein L2E82_02338 [Cichorium intybus]